MPAVPPSTLDDLGVPGCLALAALLTAQEGRTAIAPTRRMALAQLLQLRELGIIDTPWPELRWAVEPSAEETPLEHIQWRYAWPDYLRPGLLETLREFLDGVPRDDYGLALRLRFWTELAAAEAESFLTAQLKKSRFDPAWAQDMAFVVRDSHVVLPIAQWRYCAWAAVRRGASLAHQQASADPSAIREAIFGELKRRAAWVARTDTQQFSFVPFQARPDNAMSRLFVESLAPIASAFWTLPPSLDGLLLAKPPAEHAMPRHDK